MKSDTLIREQGMTILREHMGLVDAEKFITLIRRDPFDYTEWQRDLWKSKTIDDLFNAAKTLEAKEKKDDK